MTWDAELHAELAISLRHTDFFAEEAAVPAVDFVAACAVPLERAYLADVEALERAYLADVEAAGRWSGATEQEKTLAETWSGSSAGGSSHVTCKAKVDAIRSLLGLGAELPMPTVVLQGFALIGE